MKLEAIVKKNESLDFTVEYKLNPKVFTLHWYGCRIRSRYVNFHQT